MSSITERADEFLFFTMGKIPEASLKDIILQLSELGNMDHLEPEKRSKMPLKQQDQS